MSNPKSKELLQVEDLIKAGKTEEALEIVRRFQQTAWVYLSRRNTDEALRIVIQSKEIIDKIGNENDLATNFLLRGWISSQIGDIKSSLKYGLKSIDFHEKLNIQAGLSSSLFLVGLTHMNNFDFDLALDFCKKALSIKKVSPINKLGILSVLGNIYTIKGELAQALKICEEGLKLAEGGKFHYIIPSFLWYLGFLYFLLDDTEKGEEYLRRNLELLHKYPDKYSNGYTLLGLIVINLEKKNLEQAKDYLKQLEKLMVKNKGRFFEKFITSCYSISKGIILKISGRTRDRAEAEILLRKVVENEISSVQELVLKLYALLYLCDLYIGELGVSNDPTIIDDINSLISQMFDHSEKLQSNLILIGIKILQAKTELIQMKYDKAKKLLTEAQQFAELNDNLFYAQIISNEHDHLLEQQELWDTIEKTDAPFSERIQLASFEGILDRIQGKRLEESSELVPETPVFLLIITENSVPLFSYSFSRELSFGDDIISSFLSAFNTFSGELFSKGLDRAKFGEYFILIESVGSYSFCYIFKGQTYPAKQKLTSFLEEVQNNSTILQTLDKFFKTSQVAELKDLPQIENLIKDIFIR